MLEIVWRRKKRFGLHHIREIGEWFTGVQLGNKVQVISAVCCDRSPAAKTANLSSKAIELSHLLPMLSTESIWLLKLFSQEKLSKMIISFETF